MQLPGRKGLPAAEEEEGQVAEEEGQEEAAVGEDPYVPILNPR